MAVDSLRSSRVLACRLPILDSTPAPRVAMGCVVVALHGVSTALKSSHASSSDAMSHALQPSTSRWAEDGSKDHLGGLAPHRDAWQDRDVALDWLHIPRCGSSFALPFMKYACPKCADQITRFITSMTKGSGHVDKQIVLKAQNRFYNDGCCVRQRLARGYARTAHRKGDPAHEIGHMVTMLRDPVQRIMSHHAHFDKDRPLDEFLNESGTFGCQASMLLGYGSDHAPCPQHDDKLGAKMIRLAVGLVEDPRQMPFVGIVEHWNRSIALFNAKAYGDETVAPEDLENMHASLGSNRTEYEPPMGLSDPVDQAVYDAALRRFERETFFHAANARRLREMRSAAPRVPAGVPDDHPKEPSSDGAAAGGSKRLDTFAGKDMPLRWLHIPRCGSTFALPFMKYACPRCADNITSFIRSAGKEDGKTRFVREAEKRFFNDSCCVRERLLHGYEHTGHHMANATTDIGHLVTMLRDPVQRIMSHHAHFDKDRPLDEFLKKQWMFGCQASMLLGYRNGTDSSRGRGEDSMTCPYHDETLTDELVRRAVQMVEDPRQTPFVGIVEHWNRSIALFNAKAYGDETVAPEDLENMHASSGSNRTEYEPPMGLSDPVDQAVYDAALRRFERETASHAASARRLRRMAR